MVFVTIGDGYHTSCSDECSIATMGFSVRLELSDRESHSQRGHLVEAENMLVIRL